MCVAAALRKRRRSVAAALRKRCLNVVAALSKRYLLSVLAALRKRCGWLDVYSCRGFHSAIGERGSCWRCCTSPVNFGSTALAVIALCIGAVVFLQVSYMLTLL